MLRISELAALYAGKFSAQTFAPEPENLYGPMNYMMSIPGKRIRPILLLLSCDAFGGDIEEAAFAAHAIELFHNFTLVHDDIMDAATLRRGIMTVHKQYGLHTGILAGDALFTYALKYLCEVRNVHLASVLEVFNRTAIEIMEGQQMDMDFEQRLDVTIDEYLKMIGYKTSVLLACSLQIGAILGGASVEDQTGMYDFGMKLGLSFQIMDDWLDTFGESTKVGKKAGGDIIQNKKTYLLITLLNEVSEDDRKTLLAQFGEKNEQEKVKGVKALFNKYHISGKTTEKVDELYQQALTSLDSVSIPAERKADLLAMAELVHKREF